jgi:hypothetical protein
MHRFVVAVAHNQDGIVEFDDGAGRAALKFEAEKREATPAEIGNAFWDAMKKSGADPLRQNHFLVHEGSRDGKLIAALYPALALGVVLDLVRWILPTPK